MAEGNRVTSDDLNLPRSGDAAATADPVLDLRSVRDQAERGAIVMALARANGNIVKASELLGVTRPTLYDLMRRLSIQWKDADASVTASTD
jgi:two-component system NtrC family response regulator